MTANIKEIKMWANNPDKSRVSNVVRVDFNFPCLWTIFDLSELKEIISIWIDGELMRYNLHDYPKFLFLEYVLSIFKEKMGEPSFTDNVKLFLGDKK